MEKAARKNIILTALLLMLIGAATSFELYRFLKPSNLLISPVSVSVLLCITLLTLVFKHSNRIAGHPIRSWCLISACLVIGIMLCFPNRIINDYYLYYAVAVMVAGFSGLSFSLALIIGVFGIRILSDGLLLTDVLFSVLSVLSALNLSVPVEKEDFYRQTAGTYASEAVVVLLCSSFLHDSSLIYRGAAVLGLFAVSSVVIYVITSKDLLLWSAFNYSLFDEEEQPLAVETAREQGPYPDPDKVYTIAELCDQSSPYFVYLKQKLPVTAQRDYKTAMFARKVAGYSGADLELVQCGCMYKNMSKLVKPQDKESYVMGLGIPENLKNFILRENAPDFRPSNFEEIIAYSASELVSAYYYFKKQNSEFSVEKLVDSITTLLLKKGIVRDCMLSMSMFHRMKQGLSNYFNDFFEEGEKSA